MPTGKTDDSNHAPPLATDRPPLTNISPREIAQLIRALDSKLAGIEYDDGGGAPVLVYSFEVAGRRETFVVPAKPGPLVSIGDLYPDAAARERELEARYGLTFHHPGPGGSR